MDKIVFVREGKYDIDGWTAEIAGVRRFKIQFIPDFSNGWNPVLFRRHYGDRFDPNHELLERVREALFGEHATEIVRDNLNDIVVQL